MEEVKVAVQKPKQSPWDSRIARSFVAGIVLTLASLIIVGFNLSTGGSISINDDVNRYFDSCVLETFVDSTPRIRSSERGFPLAYHQRSDIPVCNEPGREDRSTKLTVIDWGSLGANILFWTCLVFIILRRYTVRKALKVQRSA